MQTSLLLRYIFLKPKAPFHYASRYNHTDAGDEDILIISNFCSSFCLRYVFASRAFLWHFTAYSRFVLKPADDELDRRKLANRIPPSQAHAEDAEE